MGAVRHAGFRLRGTQVESAPAPRERQERSVPAVERYRITLERHTAPRGGAYVVEDVPWEARAAAPGPLGYVGALRIIDWPEEFAIGPGSDVEPVSVETLRAELEEDRRALRDLYGRHFRLPI